MKDNSEWIYSFKSEPELEEEDVEFIEKIALEAYKEYNRRIVDLFLSQAWHIREDVVNKYFNKVREKYPKSIGVGIRLFRHIIEKPIDIKAEAVIRVLEVGNHY